MELLPLVELQKFECRPMPNLTNLYILGLEITFHSQIQQIFSKKLPNVKVTITNLDPAKPWSPFLVFCKKNRASVKELYPNLENRQITKILGERWGNLTLEEKLPFSDKNEIDGIAIPDDQ